MLLYCLQIQGPQGLSVKVLKSTLAPKSNFGAKNAPQPIGVEVLKPLTPAHGVVSPVYTRLNFGRNLVNLMGRNKYWLSDLF